MGEEAGKQYWKSRDTVSAKCQNMRLGEKLEFHGGYKLAQARISGIQKTD